jgi:putative transposase
MPHSHICPVYHIVFSTKQRTQLIPAASRPRLWNYLAGIARNHGMQTLAVGGTENHVHILLTLPPELAIADAVRTLKSNSSRFMRERSRLFAWQEGYGAFTVSPTQVAAVKRYIAHRRSIIRERVSKTNSARCCARQEAVSPRKGLFRLEPAVYPALPRQAEEVASRRLKTYPLHLRRVLHLLP